MPAFKSFDGQAKKFMELTEKTNQICQLQTEALSLIVQSNLPIEQIKEIAAAALSDAVNVSREDRQYV